MDIEILDEEHQEFRNHLATVTKEGKRKWIFPKKPSGRFYNARTIVSIFLLAFLIITPFIKVNGHQFLLLDFPNRHFILFGVPFGPHDFHLFVLAMISFVVFIVLFTVIFGRIFCGWICPQTIFMEMVFRKIEYWIEGDAIQQIKLKKAPWTANKIFKKGLKHIIFFAISFFIANIFLSYIISMDKLIEIVTDPPSQHLSGLFAITIFSGVFYFVFSYFREQACTLVCPYGRLQGVLLDQDSIVIAYDYKRGEPRGKLKKGEDFSNRGDCIDCHLCVDVCPTGIDIRNGIQLECVNCTACIDACDNVMDKIQRPRGLIRYASLRNIENKAKFKFTPRMMLYSVILFILLSVLTVLMINRTDFSVNILRTPGMLFQQQPDGTISNLYDLNLVNKTFDPTEIKLKLENPSNGELKIIGTDLKLEPQQIVEAKFMILLPKESITKMNTPIEIGVYDGDKLIRKIKTSFLGPVEKK
ncbi:MAG: cytochrome c oxidase accessory protein CcoG [Ignavibacterium sp.]|uniref:cytochrome c oxidase accessory protein CcoG n=1 Tax=Ignavibacterium sp. TaxID=2651167 RepID=UPI0021DBAF19|nr:cytochrome c oxidase accessory protein CcoG [Ignavibacterium sp.]BDQ04177.1 MAG: cytochrome c oxidase accessory protein CcoG [Ignavibacterium sp.]GIV46292.1 MAG: cytochrome c oxidase accessory protein CcoG [Ignavibacterium sp.]